MSMNTYTVLAFSGFMSESEGDNLQVADNMFIYTIHVYMNMLSATCKLSPSDSDMKPLNVSTVYVFMLIYQQ